MNADKRGSGKNKTLETRRKGGSGGNSERTKNLPRIGADDRGSGKSGGKIAGIAVIARHRKNKNLPLINADERGSGKNKTFETQRKGGSGGNSEDQGIGRGNGGEESALVAK